MYQTLIRAIRKTQPDHDAKATTKRSLKFKKVTALELVRKRAKVMALLPDTRLSALRECEFSAARRGGKAKGSTSRSATNR